MRGKVVEIADQRGTVRDLKPDKVLVQFPNVPFHGSGKWYNRSQATLSEDQTPPVSPVRYPNFVEPPASV